MGRGAEPGRPSSVSRATAWPSLLRSRGGSRPRPSRDLQQSGRGSRPARSPGASSTAVPSARRSGFSGAATSPCKPFVLGERQPEKAGRGPASWRVCRGAPPPKRRGASSTAPENGTERPPPLPPPRARGECRECAPCRKARSPHSPEIRELGWRSRRTKSGPSWQGGGCVGGNPLGWGWKLDVGRGRSPLCLRDGKRSESFPWRVWLQFSRTWISLFSVLASCLEEPGELFPLRLPAELPRVQSVQRGGRGGQAIPPPSPRLLPARALPREEALETGN